MFHLKTSVEHFDGVIDVSTVDLSLTGWTTGKGFETCLFFPSGRSEVVAWYGSQEAAAEGHAAFSNPMVARFIEQQDHSINLLHNEIDSLREEVEA